MRIVLADDHTLLLDALALALGKRGHEVVGQATTRRAAVALVRQFQPDACLLDIAFPTGSGLDALPELRAAGPDTKVVVLSGLVDAAVVREALEKGAHGVVDKGEPISAICAALDAVVAGQLAVDAALLREALNPKRVEDPLWVLNFLTDREWDVLHLLVEGAETRDIARALRVRSTTARTHVQNLLTKLGVHSRLQAVALVSPHMNRIVWKQHYVRSQTSGV